MFYSLSIFLIQLLFLLTGMSSVAASHVGAEGLAHLHTTVFDANGAKDKVTENVETAFDARNLMRNFTDVQSKVIGYRYNGTGSLKKF